MPYLENTTALVTGAGQGIGRGIALELATAGADVVIAHLPTVEDKVKAESVQIEMQRMGRRAFVIPMDVTDPTSVRTGLADLFTQLSRVDILVNNAGVMQRRAGIQTPPEDFDQCYEVNLKGIWSVTQALLPHFKAQGGGKIINICSTAGRKGQALTPAYCASKAAVISLTQSLAVALGPDGINVNAVCPGLVWTAQSEQFLSLLRQSGAADAADMEALLASSKELIPLRRHLSAEDVGYAVVFLASSRAQNITGQSLNVDGGYMMN